METNIEPEEEEDPVVLEVRKTKAKLLEHYNFDLDAMVKEARARQGDTGHKVVSRSSALARHMAAPGV